MSKASELILKKRRELNISQGKLCRSLGYTTPQYLSNFERGLSYFPSKKLKQACRILKIEKTEMREAVLVDTMNTFEREWGK